MISLIIGITLTLLVTVFAKIFERLELLEKRIEVMENVIEIRHQYPENFDQADNKCGAV